MRHGAECEEGSRPPRQWPHTRLSVAGVLQRLGHAEPGLYQTVLENHRKAMRRWRCTLQSGGRGPGCRGPGYHVPARTPGRAARAQSARPRPPGLPADARGKSCKSHTNVAVASPRKVTLLREQGLVGSCSRKHPAFQLATELLSINQTR